jgi:hypothetical protein
MQPFHQLAELSIRFPQALFIGFKRFGNGMVHPALVTL